jgi:hypothetical protein
VFDLLLANDPLFAATKLRDDGRDAPGRTLHVQGRKKVDTHSALIELFEIDQDLSAA